MMQAVRWLILPCGLVAGHGIGFAVAHPTVEHEALTVDMHGHLGAIAGVGLPLALAGAALTIVAGFRYGRQSVAVAPLAARQCVAFLLLELIEHGGSPSVMGEPTLWAGLAAQVLVAAAAAWLLRACAAGGDALASVRSKRQCRGHRSVVAASVVVLVPRQPRTSISGRGPPGLTSTV